MAPLQHRPCELNTIGRHCCFVGASSEEPQATQLRSRYTVVCELEAGHDCCARWYPDRSSRLLASPSPVKLRENRMRTHSLHGHFWRRTPASSIGDPMHVESAVGIPSEEPFAILASKADQTYINGRVAFEAAPKSPY